MTDEAYARDQHGLRDVVNRIHDLWFDLQRLRFDQPAGTLKIDLFDEDQYLAARSRPQCNPTANFSLTFAHVEAVDVRDTQRVRFYDINSISYDPDSKLVTISTGIPLEFRIRVTDLELALRECEEPTISGAR